MLEPRTQPILRYAAHAMWPVDEHFTHPDLEGVVLRARHYSPASESTTGATLVLLHGAGANAHWWDHVGPALAEAGRVVALDFRGHGDSHHPGHLETGAFGVDLAALLAHLGAPDAVLVGHSLGAHVALAHAAASRLTRGLVLVDAARGASPSRRRATRLALSLRRTHPTREQALARFRFLPEATRASEALRASIAERSVRAEPDGRFGYKFDPRWLGVAPGPRPDLAAVRCPTLLLRGAASRLLTPEGARELATALPRCRLVEIEDAGHHVHIDRPEAVIREIRAFLEPIRSGCDGALSSPP